MQKALFIFSAIILGVLFNFGHHYTFLIRYNLILMLFFAFLNTKINFGLFSKEHFQVLIINILLPILFYFCIRPFDENLAAMAFVIAVIPTAAAAPVIAEIMKTNVGTLTIAVVLGTPIMALVIPIMLTAFMNISGEIATLDLIFPVLTLVFIPLIISQLIRYFSSAISKRIQRFSFLSFPLFLANVFIACGNASHYIQNNKEISGLQILQIFLLVVIIGSIQFQTGQLVGRKNNPLGYSLALGRKNTMIGLWLALTYFSPIVALGPICYIIFHNTYNSFQIWQMEKRSLDIRVRVDS